MNSTDFSRQYAILENHLLRLAECIDPHDHFPQAITRLRARDRIPRAAFSDLHAVWRTRNTIASSRGDRDVPADVANAFTRLKQTIGYA